MQYKPLVTQEAFHNSSATYRLFGGAAGGGKSHAARMEALRQCLSRPKVTGIIFRKTFPELFQSIILPMLEEMPRGEYIYNESKHVMKFKNGSILFFGHCQYDKDVMKYQGAEFDFICIDELTHFTEYQFKFLLSRLRTSKEGIKPNFFGTTNPGGIGHSFVKRLWIKREFQKGERADDFVFIPSRVTDNPYITDNDPDYIGRLESMPEQQRKAFLYGDWDTFQGQVFTEFSRELHVIKPFQPKRERDGIRFMCIGLDYGYTNPSSAHFMSVDNQGKVLIYKEIHGANMTYSELADRIIEMHSEEDKLNGKYLPIYADPAVVNKKNEINGTTMKEIFNKKGLVVYPANNDRLNGLVTYRQKLRVYEDSNTKALTTDLHITESCKNLINTLPDLQHDTRNVEDVQKCDFDHCYDSTRYGIMGLLEGGNFSYTTQHSKKGVKLSSNNILRKTF